MSVNRGLIQNDKYFTQFGQLRTMGRSKFGDPVETSVVTVPLLLYQEDQKEQQTTPAVGQKMRHFATISSTWSLSEGDHLTQITDRFGKLVISDSRIVKITDYNSFRHGSRFFRLELDVELS